jgi:hypothetical protein
MATLHQHLRAAIPSHPGHPDHDKNLQHDCQDGVARSRRVIKKTPDAGQAQPSRGGPTKIKSPISSVSPARRK